MEAFLKKKKIQKERGTPKRDPPTYGQGHPTPPRGGVGTSRRATAIHRARPTPHPQGGPRVKGREGGIRRKDAQRERLKVKGRVQPLALATPHTARPALRPPLALDACPGGPWAPTERSLRARGRGGGGGGERPERACARVRRAGELAGDGMKAPPLPPAPPLAPPPQPAGWLERYKTWAKANAASLEVRSAPQRAARQGRGGKKGARAAWRRRRARGACSRGGRRAHAATPSHE